MFFMRAAVIGLGVEGKKAVNSLLKHGWEVYASDLNSNIDLSDLDLPGISLNFLDGGETFSIVSDTLTLDLGFTNSQAIDECDAIAISPSMFGGSFANKLLDEGYLLSDERLTEERNEMLDKAGKLIEETLLNLKDINPIVMQEIEDLLEMVLPKKHKYTPVYAVFAMIKEELGIY